MIRSVNNLVTVWQLVVKQSISHWRLTSAVLLGVLLASAIMSSTVIYYDALRDLALEQSLDEYENEDLDIYIHGKGASVSYSEYQRLSHLVGGAMDLQIDWMVSASVSAARTPSFFLTDWQILLDWEDGKEPDIAGYNVFRSNVSGGPYEQVNSILVTESRFIDKRLINGSEYYYVVSSVDFQGDESGKSSEVKVIPQDVTPPAIPTGIGIKSGHERVILHWDSNTESDIAGYNIYRSVGSNAARTRFTYPAVPSASFIDELVVNGTRYNYVVTAEDSSGNESQYSDEVSIKPITDINPPIAPNNILTIVDKDKVILNWDDSPDDDFAGFVVWRSDKLSGSYDRQNSSMIKKSEFIDVGLNEGVKYYYFLTSVDQSGNESQKSKIISVIPRPDTISPVSPNDPVIISGDQYAILNWDINHEDDLNGYQLLRSKISGGPYTIISQDILTSGLFIDRGLVNGETYNYVIVAVDHSGNKSSYSIEVSVVPARNLDNPDIPSELRAFPTGHRDFGNARAYFAFISGLSENFSLLSGGRWPTDFDITEPGLPLELEAMVPVYAAKAFGISVGDRLVTIPHWEDDLPYVTVSVVGILDTGKLRFEHRHVDQVMYQSKESSMLQFVPIYLSNDGYFKWLGPSFKKMNGIYSWILETDTTRLNSRNASDALLSIESMGKALSSLVDEYRQETGIDNAILDYERRVFFGKLPIFVVLALTTVVILYYVATLSSLVVEDKRNEIALLRSRGASYFHVLIVFVLEAATISVIAIIVGPFIGSTVIGMLGVIPTFAELTGSTKLDVHISVGSYLMSSVGGTLSFFSLMIPAVQACRLGAIKNRQITARPEKLSGFHKYYIDVLLLILGIVLVNQLMEQGSVFVRSQFGDLAVSHILLVIPGLIMVASAMILLRLLPPMMGLFGRFFSSRFPVGLTMGMWQIARNPSHYSRLIMLLILMVGLGAFTSSFSATFERSFKERIMYAIGSDIRVDWGGAGIPNMVWSRVASYEDLPGVNRVSPALRTKGKDESETYGLGFDFLFIDADSFGEVGWFREDFSDSSIDRLLGLLRIRESDEGIELPYGAESLGVKVKPEFAYPSVNVVVRLKNRQKSIHKYELGTLESEGWVYFEKQLNLSQKDKIFWEQQPLMLMSIGIRDTSGGPVIDGGSMLIDYISANLASGEQMIDSFDELSGWRVNQPMFQGLTDSINVYHSHPGSVNYIWSKGGAPNDRSINFRGLTRRHPLPVIASSAFIKSTGHHVGDEFEVSVLGTHRLVRIVDTVDLFPTVIDKEQQFLIADIYSLNRSRFASMPGVADAISIDRGEAEEFASNIFSQAEQIRSNQFWLSTNLLTNSEIDELKNRIQITPGKSIIFDREKEIANSKVDPLVWAGWQSLLIMSFSTVFVLSCIGFPIHAYVSFRNRQLQFALLKTVGFSWKQLVVLVSYEQVQVILLGLVFGTWMGGQLGRAIMPFMGYDYWGQKLIPPFVIELDWATLATSYVVIVFVFCIIILGNIWMVQRITMQQILRLGEN